MPEIKHQFTGGKMNKDVDERLVPNGEYRDAMNIQVSTSEGSEIGTIQNILGNKQIVIPFDVKNHRCVGSISDEKTDSVYFFLSGDRFTYSRALLSAGIFSRDYIVRLKNNSIETVFTDVKLVVSKAKAIGAYPAFDYGKNTIYTPSDWVFPVTEGDVLEKIINISSDAVKIVSHTVIHVHQPTNSNEPGFIVLDNLDPAFGVNDECYLFFRSGCLNFDIDRPITGINIIDDMLFWTDGATEPKKINISRSIKGTPDIYGQDRTLLINNDQNITISSGISVREKHITVIKKAPSKPPTLKSLTSVRQDGIHTEAHEVDFRNDTVLKSPGDTLNIDITSSIGGEPASIRPGDTILLNGAASGDYPPENYEVKALVNTASINSAGSKLNITILSISPETAMSIQDYFVAVSEEGYDLFQLKFPRFACRYRYEDGEYSSIGPFSEVAFVPGSFRYHPTEAYNKGMVNNLKSLTLKDFIPIDIPKDVVRVDLLYKDEASPAIYTVSSISPQDPAWGAVGSFPGSFGSYEVTTDNIYSVLPSNQSLRAWDNVPRSAFAQEIIGNRIVYANYLQNYNLETLPSVLASVGVRADLISGDVGRKSIKSLRTYNVGIIYGDQYGRETPVFANENSSQIVAKEKAETSNSIIAEVNTSHPSWAKYYKFFVKETSSEYYNLALDRKYNAEDGNIWLSFASTDRNKVDEDTYLILKKGVDDEDIIVEEARYKVVAIENEAPDYIKTTFTTISSPPTETNLNTRAFFGGSGTGLLGKIPSPGSKSFYLDKLFWTDDTSSDNGMGLPNLKKQWADRGSSELYVSFMGDVDNDFTQTKKYLITDVIEIAGADAVDADREVFEVFIASPITSTDRWIKHVGNVSATKHRAVIYKKVVENLPEFDGRFFVKIENDIVAQEHLAVKEEENQKWVVTASASTYYLRDSDAPVYDPDGTLSSDGTVAGEVGSGNVANDTTQIIDGIGGVANRAGVIVDGAFKAEQWDDLLRFGISGNISSKRGKWFIDEVSYAGTQAYNTGSFLHTSTDSTFTDFDSTQEFGSHRCQYEIAGCSGGSSTVFNMTEGDYGTGESLGKQWQTGISSETDTDLPNDLKHKLKLSYSMIEPVFPHDFLDATMSLPNDYWDIGTTGTHAQSEFVSQIKVGSKFRFGGETDKTYTITAFTKIRMYNYRAGLPAPYDHSGDYLIDFGAPPIKYQNPFNFDFNREYEDWSRDRMIKRWRMASNRRLCYDITYTIDSEGLGDDLPDNDVVKLMNSITSGQLEFIEPYNPDKQQKISALPAIFETEPKESVDVDIYYEASGRIPTSINGGDGEMLVPIGSTLFIEPGKVDYNIDAEDVYEDVIIANGFGAIGESGVFQHNILNITPTISYTQFLLIKPPGSPDPVVIFNCPNGRRSYVTITGLKLFKDENGDNVNPLRVNGFVVEPANKIGLNWFNCWSFGNGVESNRIGDAYNKAYLANGAKASSTLDQEYVEDNRGYGLIYSGIYNSTPGINNLNQFITAEKITKDINPVYGSIQKLHARSTADGDLIVLCEDRVLKILSEKDALYNADGNPQLIASNNVLGQAMPFSGNFGISKNPESFASDSYRIYFTDKIRGAVVRLSKDGLTPISNHGMKDWFNDNLRLSHKLVGSFDDKKNEYNITLSPREQQTYSYSEGLVVKSTTIALTPSVWE